MNETKAAENQGTQLLEQMVAARQLSATDASILTQQTHSGAHKALQTEEEVLRWLAKEYGLGYTTLEDVEPDRELLSLFPARVLLKEELLPLQRVNGVVEVATSRLFATQGLDTLKTLTGLKDQTHPRPHRSHPARNQVAPGRRRRYHRYPGRRGAAAGRR